MLSRSHHHYHHIHNTVSALDEINTLWYVMLKLIIQFMLRSDTIALFIEYRNWNVFVCVCVCPFTVRKRIVRLGVLFVRCSPQPHTKYNILIVDFWFCAKAQNDRNEKAFDCVRVYEVHFRCMCPIYLNDYIATSSNTISICKY